MHPDKMANSVHKVIIGTDAARLLRTQDSGGTRLTRTQPSKQRPQPHCQSSSNPAQACYKPELSLLAESDRTYVCAAREAVYKWWRTDNMPATREGPRLMGKPSVRFRKVVNTTTDAGQLVAVTAQQYCVLVMDVPDLEAAARR